MPPLTTAQKTIGKVLSHKIVGVEDEAANNSDWIAWFATQLHRHDCSHPVYIYSLSEGLREFRISRQNSQTIPQVKKTEVIEPPELGIDPATHYLDSFVRFKDNGIFIFQDLHKNIIDPRSGDYDPLIVSYLRTIAANREIDSGFVKRLIFLGEKIRLPNESIRLIPIVRFPLPNLKTRCSIARRAIARADSVEIIDSSTAAEAAGGLTGYEISTQIENCHRNASMTGGEFNSASIANHIIQYKTELLKRLKVEVYTTNDERFGGHEVLREWLDEAYLMMQPKIADYGLPRYKGMLLAGVSGCGKTLIAKSIASSWKLPLFKLNLGALKGRYVGESETNLKRVLELTKYLEGVMLIDEVEKGTASAGDDSTGVSGGMMSILLDHMNEQKNQFIVLTANNVEQIPSELLRSGRINERWFADLPGRKSRAEILKIHLFANPKRVAADYRLEVETQIEELSDRTKGYSGAELEEIVLRGLRSCLRRGRPQKPQLKDFIENLPIPLSLFNREQHQKIEEYKKYARLTSNDSD